MNLSRIFRANLFLYTLNYLLGVSVAVFVVLALVYASITYGFFREMNALIDAETQLLGERYAVAGEEGVSQEIARRIQEPRFPRLFYLLIDADGRRVAGNLAHWPERLGEGGDWAGLGRGFRGWLDMGKDVDFIGSSTRFADGERLLVARHYQDIIEYLRITLTVLAQAMLATIVMGVIAAVWLALITERRLSRVNRSITEILAGDLKQRIPVSSGHADDDYKRLIINFNHMLDRITQLMEGLRQLSDNIAHDLRTPLTRLRNRLASLELDENGESHDQVAGLIEEADALLATFNALLRIAQIESGNKRLAFARTDLVTILHDVHEFYEPLAAEKGQQLRVNFPASCIGVFDRDLLFQAIANLLDNAIKYTPEGGHIDLSLEARAGQLRISVCDDGPGIPPAERSRVFERFYRVEGSRSLHPGNGLGLSLVQAVITLHGGSVTLGDNAPGLCVEVLLPRSA